MDALINAPKQTLTKQQIAEALSKSKKRSFSFLDFLVIISALFVIAFLGYLYLNPSKDESDSRNTARSADISSILSFVISYSQREGEIPSSIPVSNLCVAPGSEICKLGPYDCTGLVDLSVLIGEGDEKSIVSIPTDISSKTVNGTGYYISQDGRGSVTVCAPYAERGLDLSFTKSVF